DLLLRMRAIQAGDRDRGDRCDRNAPAIHALLAPCSRPVCAGCRDDIKAVDGENTRSCHATIWLPMISIMDAVFKALADASRRSLLDRLHASNGQTLNDLCDGLAMTRQAVTKHLAILEAANLVTTFRHGREKLHYLNPVPIHQIGERWIRKFERGKLTALSELKRQLE